MSQDGQRPEEEVTRPSLPNLTPEQIRALTNLTEKFLEMLHQIEGEGQENNGNGGQP